MVITRITGGLGNQLFQYAAGKALASHNKTSLLLDITSFGKSNIRHFGLNNFNLKDEIAKEKDITRFINRNLLEKLRDHFLPVSMKKVYKEPFFHFDKTFFNAKADIYLQGYWQSERYFKPYIDYLLPELILRNEIISHIQFYGEELRNKNSVAVHIRRGDLTQPAFTAYHGILDMGYYKQAIKTIQSKIQDASFYFFSDDINWVKENLHVPGATYIDNSVTKNYIEDFYLMSQCRNNIIANSSFSWWAAWLNNDPNKIIITPKKWFNNGPKDTHDLYPEGWLII